MSTAALTAQRPVPTASRAVRLRITPRGRRVLATAVAAPLLATIAALALWGGGSAVASRDTGAPAGTFSTVTVREGDSLWAIAQRVAPENDPRTVVDEIASLNALDSSIVTPGDELAVPLHYAP